jgi:hypothetical protein
MRPLLAGLLLLLAIPAGAALPCWAYKPVHGEMVGAVGWARADTVPADQAAQRARFRAAYQLAAYAGADKPALFRAAALTGSDTTTAFGDHRLGFPARHRGEARLYVYAVLDPGDTPRITTDCRRQCRPAACDPQWLCRPMGSERAGFLGVSAGARTPYRQYRLAAANGEALLRLIYGVEVAAVSVFEQRESGSREQRRSAERAELAAGNSQAKSSARTLTAARCRHGQHAFVHVLTPDLEPLPGATREDWLSDPTLDGRPGAVGSARVPVTGRISEQIELAIRKALIALAKAQNVTVTGTTTVAQDSGGRFVLQRVAEATEALVHGQVAGLRFRGTGIERRVIVWLVEAKGEDSQPEAADDPVRPSGGSTPPAEGSSEAHGEAVREGSPAEGNRASAEENVAEEGPTSETPAGNNGRDTGPGKQGSAPAPP